MIYQEDEYLLISGIQHFVFCRRQWALIHIEQQWAENFRTTDGEIMHENAHDNSFNEKRGEVLISRAMAVSSPTLGITGECDVVEFKKSSSGTEIFGREGKYSVFPVEYKRGEPKENECDLMQLAAQAMCLEEMLCCEIPVGYLYYGMTRRRLKVLLDEPLRNRTKEAILEMHKLFSQRYTPKGKRTKACNACSMKEICLPQICAGKTALQYINDVLKEDGL